MADGSHFEKPWNRYNSAYLHISVSLIFTKFGVVTHIGPYTGSTAKISNFFKSKIAAAAILEQSKNGFSAVVWPSLAKFGRMMQNGFLTSTAVKIINSTIQDGARPPSWTNRNISTSVEPISIELGTMMPVGYLHHESKNKILNSWP